MAELLTVQATVRERGVDAHLALPKGSTTALVGPNGAGKSTIVGLVSGTIPVDEGSVVLDGETLSAPGRHLAIHARRVGVLGQRSLLFPHLSVLENVAFGPRARGVRPDDARERARAELDAVGCLDLADRRPRSLSGGQAQRVALARTLAIDPRVVLLDEPLAALDARVAAQVRRVLADRLRGLTCVLVTHDPLDVWTLADRVAVLDRGRVAAVGPVATIMGRPPTEFVEHLTGLSVLRGTADGPTSLVTAGGLHVEGLPQDGWTGAGPALATLPPDAVAVHPRAPEGSPRNQWPARVASVDPRGPVVRLGLELPDGSALASHVTAASVAGLGLVPGASVVASVKATQVLLHPQ